MVQGNSGFFSLYLAYSIIQCKGLLSKPLWKRALTDKEMNLHYLEEGA